jgi:hypothetical protein
MSFRVIQFLAVALTAFALIPAGAHLFELPNKIDLPRDGYLTVQGIYDGWAWFGIIDLAALVLNGLLAIRLRRQRPAFHFAMIAALDASTACLPVRKECRQSISAPTMR